MPDKDEIFSSTLKHKGIFNFKDFYSFCHEWLKEELGIEMTEESYEEKIKGEEKDISFTWSGKKKLSDYFRFEMKVDFEVGGLTNVEVNQGGKKVKTNSGGLKVKVKGVLVHDFQGSFETSNFQKFLRSIYEKWVIPSRVDEHAGKVATSCDKFLAQVKAYLDLEGKK